MRIKDIDPERALGPHTIALTFDDGPDPNMTPELLQTLESYCAHATFFMCGLAAKRHPDIVRTVVAAGHGIGGHTWDHQCTMRHGMPEAEWRRQVDDTQSLLEDLSGSPVKLFRPPHGIIDRPTWRRLRDQGITTVLWSIDGRDCTLREPAAIADRVCGGLRDGEIILLHDSNANFLFADAYPSLGEVGNQRTTLDATRTILDWAQQHDLTAVALAQTSLGLMPRRSGPRILARTRDPRSNSSSA